MHKYTRETLARVIEHGKRWAANQGYDMDNSSRVPRLPFSGYASERDQWYAWNIDALMAVCSYLLVWEDTGVKSELRTAFRCAMQAAEYKGRAGGQMADASWYDEHQLVMVALQQEIS